MRGLIVRPAAASSAETSGQKRQEAHHRAQPTMSRGRCDNCLRPTSVHTTRASSAPETAMLHRNCHHRCTQRVGTHSFRNHRSTTAIYRSASPHHRLLSFSPRMHHFGNVNSNSEKDENTKAKQMQFSLGGKTTKSQSQVTRRGN